MTLPEMDVALPDWNEHSLTAQAIPCQTWRADEATSVPTISATLRWRPVKVRSFHFENVPEILPRRREDVPPTKPTLKLSSRTRLLPPKDVVKLGDRLFYLLQPPLEYLLQGSTLEFPCTPFPYQFAGVAFLFTRRAAILADEMGLGKTMQAITAIRMLLRARRAQRVLLICPKPLVANWLREFKQWAPEIPVVAVAGHQAQREFLWRQDQTAVKLANYELLTRDAEWLHEVDPPYDLVVLDEAQRIKNQHNITSRIVQRIPRRRSWALTGTPIENSVDDLVGIFQFLSPGLIQATMPLKQIRVAVQDHTLRRTKDQVMTDLPPKLIRDEQLELTPEQEQSYRTAEDEGVLRLNEMQEEVTIKHVFELVMRLKQICNFDPATGSSSKMERLMVDLDEVISSGQKAIVFSQWVGTLEEIARRMPQFRPLAFHGRIPAKRREHVLAEFRQCPQRPVLLMSYGAGSVGLNLQFCRYIFLFDRWWNPAVEDQAINRAHRIGAAGSVTVSRMMTANTIEQRIHEILEAKRQLIHDILSTQSDSRRQRLSQAEIFGLFDLRSPQGRIVPKSEVA